MLVFRFSFDCLKNSKKEWKIAPLSSCSTRQTTRMWCFFFFVFRLGEKRKRKKKVERASSCRSLAESPVVVLCSVFGNASDVVLFSSYRRNPFRSCIVFVIRLLVSSVQFDSFAFRFSGFVQFELEYSNVRRVIPYLTSTSP